MRIMGVHVEKRRYTIDGALKGNPSRIHESNVRVRIPRTPRYVYPDAAIVCGAPQFDPQDTRPMTLTNPRVIIEVLSPSTEAYDRGDKFTAYRGLESLEEYVLVSQGTALIESFYRQADGTWSFAVFAGLQGAAKLRSLGIEVPMADVYAGVEWPIAEEPPTV